MGLVDDGEKDVVVVTELNQKVHCPEELFTRRACLAGLAFTAIFGAGFSIAGLIFCAKPQIEISATTSVEYLIPLAINAALTVCTECLGFIHGTTLKWSLFHEGRLQFNANLRLFTSSQTSRPNKGYVNALYLIALAICYASSGLILVTNNVLYDNDNALSSEAKRIISAPALLCLGGSLLFMAAICLWSILTTKIPTWSSCPLATLAVAIENGQERRPGRSMMSIHDKHLPNQPQHPRRKQGSAYAACKQVRSVIICLALTFLILIIWSVAVYVRAPDSYPAMPGWNIVVEASTPDAVFSLTDPNVAVNTTTTNLGLLCGVFFTAALQAVITVGMHCAELITTLSRDETIWRKLSSPKGASITEDHRSSTFHISIGSWQSMVLMVAKPIIHWQYGMGVAVDYAARVHIFVPQMVYLTMMWACFLAFVISVSFKRPKGMLPATYGHLVTMRDLVDEWSVGDGGEGRIFWGDKKVEGMSAVRMAGTADYALPVVKGDAVYA